MSRWLGAIGVGLLVAVVALLLLRPGATTDAERAAALAAQLRCPDCQGLSVADSHTVAAREIRRQIDDLVAGGASDDEVRSHFVARYGEWILLEPSSPATWLLPFVVAAAGMGLLAAWLVRRRGAPAAAPALTDQQRRRLHEEAEALDA
ncbi:MAG: cytochrome c-type biogenesis protein CcmH [Chloroflexi bacterium]|nr:cytochrome c-type biogenesis protein CcmH [Chloroflexota bacterium]